MKKYLVLALVITMGLTCGEAEGLMQKLQVEAKGSVTIVLPPGCSVVRIGHVTFIRDSVSKAVTGTMQDFYNDWKASAKGVVVPLHGRNRLEFEFQVDKATWIDSTIPGADCTKNVSLKWQFDAIDGETYQVNTQEAKKTAFARLMPLLHNAVGKVIDLSSQVKYSTSTQTREKLDKALKELESIDAELAALEALKF